MKLFYLIALMLLSLVLMPAMASANTSWQSNPDTTTYSDSATKIGQAFRVYSDGEYLTSLTVYVGTNPLDNASLNIYSGSNGTTGSLIGTAATDISGSGTVTISFSTPISIEAGSQYTWMLEQDSSFNLVISTSGTGVFSGGNLVYDATSVESTDAKFTLEASSLGNITYDGNGNTSGDVPIDTTSYSTGETVLVLGNSGNLAKKGYTFTAWNTAADGSGDNYEAGDSFTSDGTAITLYAQWQKKFPWPLFIPK